MSEIRTSVIKFKSANGADTVVGRFFEDGAVRPKCILQISHGMCEYIGRYADFAAFMAQNGYAVCGNDHLGHGDTSEGGTDGYFAPKDGAKAILADLHTMNGLARRRYPGLPVILLGHSMGSFFARLYAATYPQTIDALLLSGTAGPNPLCAAGIFLTDVLGALKGPWYRSQLVNRMAFGQYLKRIPSPRTPYDWISRDEAIVDAYARDAKCTFVFTVSAFHEMLSTLRAVSGAQWAQKLPKDLPVGLFSGDMDPVGDYGRGVQKVAAMLRAAQLADVQLTLYPGARHEVLNETNRAQVYKDMLTWCDAHMKNSKQSEAEIK